MKALSALVAVAWLAGWTFAGYRLTARSFAWVDALPGPSDAGAWTKGPGLLPDFGALREKLPSVGQDTVVWFKNLSSEKQSCLRLAVGEERAAAALRGEDVQPTPREMLAIAACLQ